MGRQNDEEMAFDKFMMEKEENKHSMRNTTARPVNDYGPMSQRAPPPPPRQPDHHQSRTPSFENRGVAEYPRRPRSSSRGGSKERQDRQPGIPVAAVPPPQMQSESEEETSSASFNSQSSSDSSNWSYSSGDGSESDSFNGNQRNVTAAPSKPRNVSNMKIPSSDNSRSTGYKTESLPSNASVAKEERHKRMSVARTRAARRQPT